MTSAMLKAVCNTGIKASMRPNWMFANGAIVAAAIIKVTARRQRSPFAAPSGAYWRCLAGSPVLLFG